MKKAEFIKESVETGTKFDTVKQISGFLALTATEQYDDGKISLDDIIPYISQVEVYTDYVKVNNLDSDWLEIVAGVESLKVLEGSQKSKKIENIKGLLTLYKNNSIEKKDNRHLVAEMYEKKLEEEYTIPDTTFEEKWKGFVNSSILNEDKDFMIKNKEILTCKKEYVSIIENNPSHPLYQEIMAKYEELKQNLLLAIQDNPSACSYGDAKDLFDEGIFTDKQFCDEYHLMTSKSWAIITQKAKEENNAKANHKANPYDDTIALDYKFDKDNDKLDNYTNATDVFFFGIPGSGKTCALMGLAALDGKEIELSDKRKATFKYVSVKGGMYMDNLKSFYRVRSVPPQTKESFSAIIEAEISVNDKDRKSTHRINLIESAGEVFKKKLADSSVRLGAANNDSKKGVMEDMGEGITKILTGTGNPKIFLFFVDPTQDFIEEINKSQSDVIKTFIDISERDESAKVYMPKVEAFHIVITKSDILKIKAQKGSDILKEKYKEANYAITSYCDKNYLITDVVKFSIAKNYYIGDYYEPDDKPSINLIETIINSTTAIRTKKWTDDALEWLNTPLFS